MLKYNYYGTDLIDSNPIVFKKGKKKKKIISSPMLEYYRWNTIKTKIWN